jgi:hypothetical protein
MNILIRQGIRQRYNIAIKECCFAPNLNLLAILRDSWFMAPKCRAKMMTLKQSLTALPAANDRPTRSAFGAKITRQLFSASFHILKMLQAPAGFAACNNGRKL